MGTGNSIRLSKLAREFNVGIHTIVEFLHKNGFDIDSNPNTKIDDVALRLLEKEYKIDISLKKESQKINTKSNRPKNEIILIDGEKDKSTKEPEIKHVAEIFQKIQHPQIKFGEEGIKVLGKIDLDSINKPKKEKKEEPQKEEIIEKSIEKVPVEVNKATKMPTIEVVETEIPKIEDVKVIGKIDLKNINQKTRPAKKTREEIERENQERLKKKAEIKKQLEPENVIEKQEQKIEMIKTSVETINGPTVIGKIDLPDDKRDKKPAQNNQAIFNKKKRKRISNVAGKIIFEKKDEKGKPNLNIKPIKKHIFKKEVNEEDVQKQIKDTLARLTAKGKSKGSKHRRDKRTLVSERMQADAQKRTEDQKIIKVTEFVSVSELANMMDVGVNKIIAACMSLGLLVSINQRLNAETLSLVAEEFGFSVEFVSVEIQEAIEDSEDSEYDLISRPPIVTVMGHVDHGKTSLLDYIRNTNVIAGEAGGITQHIGAYHITLDNGRKITFLDTPGHEAFTAMRARGAQITDIAIIIVAADDSVMPQTVEAINHATAAGVPIVFAINKIDKPSANPDKIKEALANMNFLVEEWGGKYQSHDISAKKGIGVEELLEKVLLEADLLDLKANPDKNANGTIIESSLDKGRGYIATILVQSGTLRVGDIVIAGQYYGNVKAMFNERNQKIDCVGPAEPAIILGLNGSPQAGDKFNVLDNEREVRNIANKREQLAREQGLRTQKHITLDEIGRRIAIGNFKELNLIVKGDVDGSVEALSDSLIKLSTEEIQVNIKHKAVGQISESDILLAAASEAIVVGFQVRPSLNARKLAEKEQIDIRLYSIIYDAINEIKAAMEGMLSPEIKEEITGTAEVLETFRITKVGTVAGCIVRDGKITRNSKVKIIRDGIVVYTGSLGSLKRFKEDVKEVKNGYECGLNIDNYNDIKKGDLIESFREIEIAKHL
ncbi:MAG: translation initiation factor IF-2 [Bacteroidales bacterium]|jgi:translation initiation factor IF-2|nr:translation initiation factor IF-2 [Bacteroidales bacterium]